MMEEGQASSTGGAAAPNTGAHPPPAPVFGFSRDDSINLEDIFTDWFNEDNLNGPPPNFPAAPDPPQPAAAAAMAGGMMPALQPRGGGAAAQAAAQALMPKGRGGANGQEEEEEDEEDDEQLDAGSSTGSGTGGGGGGAGGGGGGGGGGRKKRPRGNSNVGSLAGLATAGSAGTSNRRMTEEQKVERRERNREHAKRSRVRKKFLLESLQKSVNALQEENDKLRSAIKGHLKDEAAELLRQCEVEPEDSLLTSDPASATKILDDPDYTLVKALQTAQQNFVITDPTLPDNPIVYASGGFLQLTGYKMDQILGRNCRFLQGPETDPAAVDKIRRAIEDGSDGSVCLLNYRADGSTFWNQFFIAALRGADGTIVNYVGVQCKVSEEYAREVLRKELQEEEEGGGGNGGGGGAEDDVKAAASSASSAASGSKQG